MVGGVALEAVVISSKELCWTVDIAAWDCDDEAENYKDQPSASGDDGARRGTHVRQGCSYSDLLAGSSHIMVEVAPRYFRTTCSTARWSLVPENLCASMRPTALLMAWTSKTSFESSWYAAMHSGMLMRRRPSIIAINLSNVMSIYGIYLVNGETTYPPVEVPPIRSK